MSARNHPPTKDRRDIGQVVSPIEKMMAARELSSCCVGVEAALETNSGFAMLMRHISDRDTTKSRKPE
jgi:hypothetical protein